MGWEIVCTVIIMKSNSSWKATWKSHCESLRSAALEGQLDLHTYLKGYQSQEIHMNANKTKSSYRTVRIYRSLYGMLKCASLNNDLNHFSGMLV